jgi:hypothetical protein
MGRLTRSLGIAALIVSGLLGSPKFAAAAVNQELTGEIIRVEPGEKQVLLRVLDGAGVEGRQVTVRVDRKTRLQGVGSISELKEGGPVKAEVKKNWFSDQWTATRLVYVPAEKGKRTSPTDKAQLHDVENRFAHGQMGDIEYETKRQEFEK